MLHHCDGSATSLPRIGPGKDKGKAAILPHHRLAATILAACLIGLVPSLSALAGTRPAQTALPGGAPSTPADGDAAVLQAAEAWRSRNPTRLARVAGATRNHVLAPWVEYWQLALSIDQASAANVQDFAARYPGSLAAERLRGDWLRALARRQQWGALHAEAASRLPEDPELLCLTLDAAGRSGAPPSPGSLQGILTLPRTLPDACANLIGTLTGSASISSADLWRRVRVLVEAGSLAGIQQVTGWLDQNERPEPRALALAWTSPLAALHRHGTAQHLRTSRELQVIAFTRLARTDPQQAAQAFDPAVQSAMAATDRAFIAAQIGVSLARLHAPDASNWFEQVDGNGLGEETLAWRVRAALREEKWPRVRAAIDQMPAAMSADPAWVYWSARADRALGSTALAQAQFVRIASGHDFYGTLATEELGQTPRLPERMPAPAAADVEAAGSNPSLARAVAFFSLGLRSDAVSEWNWGLRGLTDAQLLAAAEHARRLGLWDRAINTAERTRAAHDFGLRFLAPYQAVFEQHARNQSLLESWVLGVARQESRFVANIRSSAGAVGLMQLMPATARLVARRIGIDSPDLTDPQTNVRLGTSYLRQVLDRLDSQPLLASAGYNAGPGRAERWRAPNPLEGAIYAETIPFNETRDYVKRVLANTVWYAQVLGQPPVSLKSLLATVPPRTVTTLATDTSKR